ncbi:NAD-dependent epimerase/dehydratase family protein [Gryllotalpicola protaetiae]|uniref:NAD-dependent epimerase/dehydratase family protein n=1 Tax=Gryllotalpicola protaetiae TaxID=2419771 RepID=A0A387BN59_9MICO|nr:NAD-dependent epimerase/dehydratase family protein [Gryllotalpicola protaetiae]AYG04138.1 NAD-dependent epimerase/dehydratase family protein [Gryllotalpicola protaetiae]
MLEQDAAALNVLFLGGTGTISASSVRLAVAHGIHVSVLNRGANRGLRELPAAVEWLTADVTDDASVIAAVGDRSFDAVVNFLSYDEDDVARMVELFDGRTRQYVHISSASIYSKPVRSLPISESTPTGPNPPLPYATAKWRAEQALWRAYLREGFPVTVVRPSHTYDDAHPPLPGDWTVIDRLARGAELPVHGDGTSLWTLTHAEDFAHGLVGLLGSERAIGETFHITGDDVLTWDQIYDLFARGLGVEPNLVHVPSELFPVVAPEWFWSGEFVGDLGHSAVFDNTKIRRFVPGFAPKLTFERAVRRMLDWRAAHPEIAHGDTETDALFDRVVRAYHAGRRSFVEHAPAGAGQNALGGPALLNATE